MYLQLPLVITTHILYSFPFEIFMKQKRIWFKKKKVIIHYIENL